MAEQIGRYEIINELGRGGMATVFLATDPRFGRRVAIKVLPRQFTHDPRFLARFETEAQTIATLEHPAIVPVYDFGEHDDAPYLVMRYMAGGSLRGRMHGRPLPLEELVTALERVTPALDLAHERGIIHRDLKPANVLFDSLDNPYLADFGIARLAEATHTMTVIGTPAYMSPEQVQGKEKLDGRSDIYALGIMLYELLTGEQPYVAETPTGQMMAHVLEPVPDVLTANPDLPSGMQNVIDRAMAKDREERYTSAAELVAALATVSPEETADTSKTILAASLDSLPEITEEEPAETAEPPELEPSSMSEGEAPSVPEPEAFDSVETVVELAPPEPEEVEPDDAPAPADDPVYAETALPAEPQSDGRRLPGWIWWVGALLILALIVFGVRSYLGSELPFVSEEPALATPQPATAADEAPDEAAESEPAAEEPAAEEDGFQVVEDAPVPPSGTYLERALTGEFEGAIVSLNGPYIANSDRISALLDPFEEATGIDVEYAVAENSGHMAANFERGSFPDVANIVNPALLAHLTREGHVPDLREFLLEDRLMGAYTPPWIETMTMDGPDGQPIVAGLMHSVVPGGVVWYPKAQFDEAGYQVPGNWDELLALSERMEADGRTPWCIGLEAGDQTGNIATDWVESIMLRTAPAEIYELWINGDLPFSSPEVANAVDIMSQIWFNDTFVFNGTAAIPEIPWTESPLPMFEDPPGCWLHLQTPLIRRSFDGDLEPGVDYDFFVLPPIDEAFGTPLIAHGDFMVLFNDRPEAIALMEYFASGWSTESWVREGERVSPNLQTDVDLYPTPVDRKLAQVVLDAQYVRFDASRMMPPEVGERSFNQGMTDYVSGVASLETVLFNIDDAWLAVRGERGRPEGDCHEEDIFCIGLVTSTGSIDDNAFNQAAWEGVLHAAEQIGARADFIESADVADYGQNIDRFVEEGFDLIVTVGFTMGEATLDAAAWHPGTRFIGVDQFHPEPVDNLTGLIFHEDQAGFLAGALAAMLSESNIVGSIMGSDEVEPVVAFSEGFGNGARFVNSYISLWPIFHRGGLDVAFTDPEWGADVARDVLNEGADVIFAAAGETGNGTLVEVAGQDGAYCIGVDTDQWLTLPEARPCLVSSAIKQISPGVTDLVIRAYEGQLPPGNTYGSVGLAPFHDFEDQIPLEVKAELEAIHAGLLNGDIETGYNRGE